MRDVLYIFSKYRLFSTLYWYFCILASVSCAVCVNMYLHMYIGSFM